MRGRRLVAASYSIAKQLPLEVGLHQDDFSNEKSVLTALTSSFALLAFSKYRRAQITPNIDLYCIIRFIYWFFTVLHFTGFRKYRAQTPHFQTYIAEKFFIILIFTVPFCDYTTLLCHRFRFMSCHHSVSCDKAHHHAHNCYDCPELMFLQHVKISFLDEPKPCVAL